MSDVEMSGDENIEVARQSASPQKELRKRKRVSDSASLSPSKSVSVSPKKVEQSGRKTKARKVVMSESEEEEDKEEEDPEDDVDDDEEEGADDDEGSDEDAEDEDEEEDEEEDEGEEKENAFEVEKIIGHKKDKKGEVLYHVKWVGYPDEENTYEPKESFDGAPKPLEAYLKSLSDEAREEIEGKKKNKRSVSPAKKTTTPASKAKSTSKTNKKTIDDDEEEEEEEVAVVKKAGRATAASASKSKAPAAKTKSVADFFKPKTSAKAAAAAPQKKKTAKEKEKEREDEEKKQAEINQGRLDKIMATQLKAAKFAEGDPIGAVVEKGAIVLHTLIKYDADPEKLFAAVDDLKKERATNEELDKTSGKPRGSDKGRDEIYMLSEALENAMWWYADREQKLRNPVVKPEPKIEPAVAESVVAEDDPMLLCAVSTHVESESDNDISGVPLPKREVKDENFGLEKEMEEEEETSAPAEKTAPAPKTIPAAQKTGTKKAASPKKSEGTKKNDASNKKVASLFNPFKCKTCPDAFKSRAELLAHGKEAHA